MNKVEFPTKSGQSNRASSDFTRKLCRYLSCIRVEEMMLNRFTYLVLATNSFRLIQIYKYSSHFAQIIIIITVTITISLLLTHC